MRDRPVLTFAIALTPVRTPALWRFRCAMLSATLRSIYNQTDGDFRVILAGDRSPDLHIAVDDRLEFIRVRSRPSSTPKRSWRDHSRKLRVIATRLAAAGGGCLMPVDMDDLVSNRLVAFVRAHPDPNGYLLDKGYALDARTNLVAPVIHPGGAFGPLHKACGSSAILNLAPEDVLARWSSRLARLRREGHYMIAEEAIREGRPLLEVPFRAVIYTLNHGGNLSDTWGGEEAMSLRHRLLDAIARGGRPASEFTAEFGVPARYPCADEGVPRPATTRSPRRGPGRWPPLSLSRLRAALTSLRRRLP